MSAEPSSDPSATPARAATRRGRRATGLGVLQRLGRSLMLPIAALPVAALLLRLGQPDMLGDGDTGLALGGALALAHPGRRRARRRRRGAVQRTWGCCSRSGSRSGSPATPTGRPRWPRWWATSSSTRSTDAMSPYVLAGRGAPGASTTASSAASSSGSPSALLWQRYHRIRLPPYLAFFGGRRFVPIVTACATLGLGVVLSFAYPAFETASPRSARWLVGNDDARRRRCTASPTGC